MFWIREKPLPLPRIEPWLQHTLFYEAMFLQTQNKNFQIHAVNMYDNYYSIVFLKGYNARHWKNERIAYR